MRTYGLTMLPDNGGIVPVLMPFYTAEAHNSLERGSRPYSVVEILLCKSQCQVLVSD